MYVLISVFEFCYVAFVLFASSCFKMLLCCLCVCVLSFLVWNTRERFLSLCILFSGSFLILFALDFYFCYLSKSNSPKRGIRKMTNAQKGHFQKVQLVQLCSLVLFCFFGGVLKIAFFQQKCGLSPQKQKHKKAKQVAKNWSKVVFKIGTSMLRNTFGPFFNATFWSFLKLVVFFFKSLILPSERRGFWQQKTWTNFNTKKGLSWTTF